MEKYDFLDKTVDAYLDTYVSAIYACKFLFGDYFPSMRVVVRLVKNGSNEILYQEAICYGYEEFCYNYGAWRSEDILIAADKKYFFANFKAIMGEPERAIEGFKVGIPLITKQVVQDLAK